LGTNIGVRSARNDWIAIVNPDVKVTLGQLKELCAIAAAANIACLGPQVIDQAGCVVSTARSTIRPPWRGSGFRPTVSGDLTFCESISGCCMVMRREEFERVGGFDRYFFMFAEEIDLHSRITSDGGKVAVTRQVTVQTPGGGSSSSVSKRWNATEREVAHVRYVRKHFGMVDASVDFVWRVLRILGGGVYVPRLDSLRQLWRGVSDSTRSMR
jgi:GT2 family glycosyltransferase